MSIRAAIHHLTHYKYDRPVSLGPQMIRLRPAPHSRTRVISHSLKVMPAEHFVNHQQDPYGNWLARYVFPELVDELRIEVDVVADMTVYNPFDFFIEESAETWPFEYGEDLRPDLVIYRTPEPAGPRLQAFLDRIDRAPKRTVDFVVDLNRRLSQEIKYIVRMEPGVQNPEETFGSGSGSCREFGLALGADSPPSAPGRALRLRLSHPAQTRSRRARRAAGNYSPPQVLQIDGRLCHLVLAFLVVGDVTNSRAPSLHGRYPASTLLRTHPSPSRLRSTSRLSRLYDRPCSGDFAPGRGGLLQLLGMSLPPCCRFHPAEVKEPHRSDFGSPCCLRPPVGGSAFGATHFRGHFCVHCCYGPVTRRLPTGDVVDRLQSLGFPPPCYPNYGASDFCPGRPFSC